MLYLFRNISETVILPVLISVCLNMRDFSVSLPFFLIDKNKITYFPAIKFNLNETYFITRTNKRERIFGFSLYTDFFVQ